MMRFLGNRKNILNKTFIQNPPTSPISIPTSVIPALVSSS